uniref:Putative secreted protein n=1 Tax=Anopheles darlingi TaxID=43151 RepID=A0A2M4DHL9_ANODA
MFSWLVGFGWSTLMTSAKSVDRFLMMKGNLYQTLLDPNDYVSKVSKKERILNYFLGSSTNSDQLLTFIRTSPTEDYPRISVLSIKKCNHQVIPKKGEPQ